MVVRKTDSKGRVVLPKELRGEEVSIIRIGRRGIIIPVGDPYKSLSGKLSAPPLRELRKRTEEWLLEETIKDAE